MTLFMSILVFLLVLFAYVHIMAQYAKSQDMEIYEADFAGNAGLQEICDVRQPVVVELRGAAPGFFAEATLPKFLRAGATSLVALRDGGDYLAAGDAPVEGIALPFKTVVEMLDADADARLFSDGNADFAEDADLAADLGELDRLLRPPGTVQTRYDVMLGARGAHTPLRWAADHRRFVVVCAGSVSVKMTPFKSGKYLHEVRDYASCEFRSQIDVWAPPARFAGDLERVKFLEFELPAGSALYVPPYWWYSLRYAEAEDSLLLGYTYNTLLNRLANAGDLARCALQRHNTVTRVGRERREDAAEGGEDEGGEDDSASLAERAGEPEAQLGDIDE